MSSRPEQVRWDLLGEHFTTHVLDGDETTARRQVSRLHRRGVPVRHILDGLFVPAAVAVGECWASGAIGVAEEHRATAIMERMLGELTPRVGGRRRGSAVVATWEGEHHTLPTTMAAAALREDRWTVDHLGSGLPTGELVRFVRSASPDLAVLSVTVHDHHEASEEIGRELEDLGTPTLVGGPGRTLDELCALSSRRVARLPRP